MIGTMIMQIIGLLVFVKQFPNPIPSIFGYHEIFHVFVVIAGNEMALTPLFAVDMAFS